jgi:hypothetical protein
MLTGEGVKVEVTEQDIMWANEDFCPITKALSRTLKEETDSIQVQRKSVLVFDDYDLKKESYNYEDDSVITEFLDSWDRYMCGSDEYFAPFKFSLIKR